MSSRHTHEDTTLKSACVRARACVIWEMFMKCRSWIITFSCALFMDFWNFLARNPAPAPRFPLMLELVLFSAIFTSLLSHSHTLSLLSNTHSHTLLPFCMRVAVWLPLEHCAGRSAAGERISFYSCLLRHGAHVECVNTLTQLHACQNVRVCVRARCSVPPKLKTKSERKKKF